MSVKIKISDDTEGVNENIEKEQALKKVREEVSRMMKDYRVTMTFMASDAPISILCFPIVVETALNRHGCLRVYDLFNCDFAKVKGLSVKHIRDLTSRLQEFISAL